MQMLIKRSCFLLPVFILGIIVLSSAGCKNKQGCMDTNAVNYNSLADEHDGFCSYRHLVNVNIIKLPLTDPQTLAPVTWDILTNPAPDIKFYLKPESYSHWVFETSIVFDINKYPYLYDIVMVEDDYLLWNEEYTFMFTDEDQVGYDIIFSGSFVPRLVYNNDKIILINSTETVEIELSFVVY